MASRCLVVACVLSVLTGSSGVLAAQPGTTPGLSSVEMRGGVAATGVQKGAVRSKKARGIVFDSPEAIMRWQQGYRSRPEPERIAEAFLAMSRLGMFREMEQAGLYLGFVGAVIGSLDTDKAAAALARMFPLPPEDQAALVKMLAMSGHPSWKALLRGLAERMPSRGVLIDRYLTGRLPSLETVAMDAGPQPLDVLWGHYFASGSYEPILRIISVLKWAEDVNDVERLTIGSMAKFTLAQNGARDTDLLQQLKAALGHETGITRKVLVEVIEAAETAETAKIRKDALVAIEQLKVKGPQKTRNAQWWGQAGQTALALGCVVASATGAGAGIGLPCVLGGALSGLALKALQ